jgi:hypothetical protein
VVNFLRGAHRAVTVDELSKTVRYEVASSPELLASLSVHPRVALVGTHYKYRPRYNVSNKDELFELVENSEEGVVATELYESYHKAKDDIAALVAERRILSFRNKQLASDILFSCYTKYDLGVAQSLKVHFENSVLCCWLLICNRMVGTL